MRLRAKIETRVSSDRPLSAAAVPTTATAATTRGSSAATTLRNTMSMMMVVMGMAISSARIRSRSDSSTMARLAMALPPMVTDAVSTSGRTNSSLMDSALV